jgi:TRAP-type mannitol/chloroaromatic compound transport system permease small subunit
MTIYLHGSLFLLCAAYALGEDEHVRVDIFYRNWSKPRKAFINFLGQVLFVQPMAWLTLLISIDYVSFSWSIGEVSPEPGGLPIVYVLKSMLLVFAFLLIMQSAAMILKYFEDR